MIRRTYFIYSILIYLFCFNYHIFSKSKRKKSNPAPAHYNIYTILTIHFMICYNCHALFIYMVSLYIGICFFIFFKNTTNPPRPYYNDNTPPRVYVSSPARCVRVPLYYYNIYSIIVTISQPCRCYVIVIYR